MIAWFKKKFGYDCGDHYWKKIGMLPSHPSRSRKDEHFFSCTKCKTKYVVEADSADVLNGAIFGQNVLPPKKKKRSKAPIQLREFIPAEAQ